MWRGTCAGSTANKKPHQQGILVGLVSSPLRVILFRCGQNRGGFDMCEDSVRYPTLSSPPVQVRRQGALAQVDRGRVHPEQATVLPALEPVLCVITKIRWYGTPGVHPRSRGHKCCRGLGVEARCQGMMPWMARRIGTIGKDCTNKDGLGFEPNRHSLPYSGQTRQKQPGGCPSRLKKTGVV